MVNLVGKATIVLVALIAALYQFLFKSIIFDLLGYGRVISPLHTFNNVRCEKIDDLGLEGCEDMWLHEPTGFLYMSCGESKGRMEWLPAFVPLCDTILNGDIDILQNRSPQYRWTRSQ